MVWIHGGGNTIGEGGFYNGGNLAATHHVVVVTLNYRLGPFGWLRHAALRGDGATELDRSGNFGTLDLVRALQWVRDNIAAFGGDPGNVTIFGESAGGTNVYSLLLSPQAHGAVPPRHRRERRLLHERRGARRELHRRRAAGRRQQLERDAAAPADGRRHGDRPRRGEGSVSPPCSRDEVARYLRGKSNVEILTAYTPDARAPA